MFVVLLQKGAHPELTVHTLSAQDESPFLRLEAMDNMCVYDAFMRIGHAFAIEQIMHYAFNGNRVFVYFDRVKPRIFKRFEIREQIIFNFIS